MRVWISYFISLSSAMEMTFFCCFIFLREGFQVFTLSTADGYFCMPSSIVSWSLLEPQKVEARDESITLFDQSTGPTPCALADLHILIQVLSVREVVHSEHRTYVPGVMFRIGVMFRVKVVVLLRDCFTLVLWKLLLQFFSLLLDGGTSLYSLQPLQKLVNLKSHSDWKGGERSCTLL